MRQDCCSGWATWFGGNLGCPGNLSGCPGPLRVWGCSKSLCKESLCSCCGPYSRRTHLPKTGFGNDFSDFLGRGAGESLFGLCWDFRGPVTPVLTRGLPSLRQEKRAQRFTFWVRRPPGGVGVFHAKGRWPEKFVLSLENLSSLGFEEMNLGCQLHKRMFAELISH